VTLLRFEPDALGASRFALSPLAETLGRLNALRRELDRGPRPSADAEALREWLGGDPFAAGLLRLTSATKFLPDFVAIPPAAMTTRIEDELAEMRAFGDPAARSTLDDSRRFARLAVRTQWSEVEGIAGRAAEVFARGWERFVRPDWPRRRAIMERDIRYRAGVLAVSGWQQAIDGMAKFRWAGPDTIQFSTQDHPDRFIGSEGLVFVPHTGPDGQWTCELPPRLALVYPARGAGAEAPRTGGGVAKLIGAGRTRLLHALRDPASPSHLAVLLGLSLGTVSGHLAALRDAGLVVGRRSGRTVYYERTESGEALAQMILATTPLPSLR
jgi:DNA-binding transcriptional ArsR family regulator